MSADGQDIAFVSLASNIVPGSLYGIQQIYVRNLQTGINERISVSNAGNQDFGGSYHPAISGDGRLVAFTSFASGLVPGDTNGATDIFVRDRASATTSRVSVSSAGVQGDDDSSGAALSADGRFVAFQSAASNLVPGDTNGAVDIFVHEIGVGTTTRVNLGPGGLEANAGAETPELSRDGRYVAFSTAATNLVPGGTPANINIFVHDRVTGVTSLISADSNGIPGNGDDVRPSISGNGRFVAFAGGSTNLVPGDTNGYIDVFAHDRHLGTTERVSVGPGGAQANDWSSAYGARISSDGRVIAFDSFATNLVVGGTTGLQTFFVERATGEVTLASVNTNGASGNSNTFNPAISGNGRFIAFDTGASDLVPTDTNGWKDVFVRDRELFFSTYCSPATPNSSGVPARISAAGRNDVALNDLTLTALELPNGVFGYFLVGSNQGAVMLPGSQGVLCLSGAVFPGCAGIGCFNSPGQIIRGPSGSLTVDLTALPLTPRAPVQPGETWNFQCWYRDANPGPTSNFTDAVSVTFM